MLQALDRLRGTAQPRRTPCNRLRLDGNSPVHDHGERRREAEGNRDPCDFLKALRPTDTRAPAPLVAGDKISRWNLVIVGTSDVFCSSVIAAAAHPIVTGHYSRSTPFHASSNVLSRTRELCGLVHPNERSPDPSLPSYASRCVPVDPNIGPKTDICDAPPQPNPIVMATTHVLFLFAP